MLRACLATSAQTALLAAQLTPPPPAGGSCEQQQQHTAGQRECEHVQQICQRVQKAMRRRARRTAAASSSRDNQSSCSGDSLGSLSSCDSFGARRRARRLLCSLRGGTGAKQPALERASADSSEETASEVSCDTAIFLGPSALQRPPPPNSQSSSRAAPATSATPAPFPQSSLRQQPIPEALELSGPQCQWLASRPQFTYSKGLASYGSSPARFPSAKQPRTHARPASCAGPEESQEIWVDGPPELLAPASSASPACHSSALQFPSQTPTCLCTTLALSSVHPEGLEAAAVVPTSNEHTDEAQEMVESQSSQSSQLSSASLADKSTQCDEPFSESGSTSCSTSASAPSECSVRMAHSAAQGQVQVQQRAEQCACLLEAPALPPPSRAPLSDIEEGYEGALGASTQTESSGSGSGPEPEPEPEREQELIANEERRELAPVNENAESQYSAEAEAEAEVGVRVAVPLLHSCPPSLSSTPLHQLRAPLLGEGPESEAEAEVDEDEETESADLQFEIGAPYENLRLIRRLTEKLVHGTKPHIIDVDSLHGDTPHCSVNQRPENNRAVLSSTLLFGNNSNPNGTLFLFLRVFWLLVHLTYLRIKIIT